MFTMSTLTVRQYTPKVPNSITHKLPAKPCWPNFGKEPVKPLLVSAKAVEDNERQKKPAIVSELVLQENPLFDAKKAQGVSNS